MKHAKSTLCLVVGLGLGGANLVALAPAEPQTAAAQAGAVSGPALATRGLASRLTVVYPHRLRARQDHTPQTPIRVRVEMGAKPGEQIVEFIGNRAGEFDVRDFLAREDGGAVADLAPLPVRVVSNLPRAHGSDIFESGEPPVVAGGGYRALMIGLGAAWVLVPVVVLVRRALRAKPAPVVEVLPVPEPTLAERLKTAIDQARARQLSAAERAGLELMVIRYLCQRSGRELVPALDHAGTLEILRLDERTRGVVLAIERWLHAGRADADRARDGAAAIEAISQLEREAARHSQRRHAHDPRPEVVA